MSQPKNIIVQRVPRERIYELRHAVLRHGLPREAAAFPGEESPQTVHLAALDGEQVVGCATVLVVDVDGQRTCQLRGMAVREDYRRHGVGRKLLHAVHQVAREKGVAFIWANCRVGALKFYLAMGWRFVIDPGELPTSGPDWKMQFNLAANATFAAGLR